jgi:protein-S-isoprenylcysteine O-methyltransferase Ste14
MPDLVTAVALAACWGTVLGVWCIVAVFNIGRAPQARIRDRTANRWLIGATGLCAVLVLASRSYWSTLAFDNPWLQALGLAVLIVSTVFAVWARLALGSAWSVVPEAGGDRRLHTSGPYGVTRHPIYTGLLGMIAGSALLTGSGQVIILVPVGVLLFAVKIHFEERLLASMFPDEYTLYRSRVPKLVPGLLAWRH